MISNEKKFKLLERLRRFLMLISIAAVVALLYWNKTLPLFAIYIFIAVIIFSVLTLAYFFVVGLSFFSYEQVEDVLIFKFYETGNFSFKRSKISIPKNDFVGYTVTNNFFSLQTLLLLFENLNGRKATYPPINISALAVKEKEELILALQSSLSK